MQIPFGRRRIVLSLVAAPPRRIDIPEAEGASDAELARLSRTTDVDLRRENWATEAVMIGFGRH